MSRQVAAAAMRGAAGLLNRVAVKYQEVLSSQGGDAPAAFPDTAYHAPMIFALTGVKIQKVREIGSFLDYLKTMVHPPPTEATWLPYLGDALDAGVATLMLEELLMLLRYVAGSEPKAGYPGFLSDTQMRTLGVQLVDGRMPGFAAILGAIPDPKAAVKLVRELQERSILTFLCGNSNGLTMKQHLEAEGVQMGWDTYIVPLGDDTESAIYALDWAVRSALTFGGLQGGAGQKCLEYCRDRVFAFGLALGGLDDLKYATGAGAIAMGFPVIATDAAVPEIHPTGVCTYEALVREPDLDNLVPRAIEVRGLKLQHSKPPIPVLYGTAFEGERVRKEDMVVEFGGKRGRAYEWVTMAEFGSLEDGKITVTGPALDQLPAGYGGDLAILVTVAGRKMQKDFESILERQIHHLLNQAQGVMHIGQRSIVWLRVSKAAKAAGFTLDHLGTIIHTKLHGDYPALVDQVAIEIITDSKQALARLAAADAAYKERDARVAGMTDESVDTFYSCTLCQSFAPNHVCVITPERLGLCGAYNWLDGKAAFEINPTGGNQPIVKGECLQPVTGQWRGINDFVESHSNRTIKCFSAYSILDSPMTSCGCFEAIATVLPGTGGVMVVHREHQGMTPSGMTFSTLAGVVGGGQQQPGFIGIGINYIVSKKFISAEGGLKRLVWMPRELKERLRPELEKRARELGVPDLVEKIVDESRTDDLMKTVELLVENGHPAPALGELI